MRFVTCFFLAVVAVNIFPASAQPPNIVFILADDMGHADLGCYGAPDAKTPNIDQLAADGVRFTQAYAMGTECSPSRTSILTGRYPQRVGGMECAIGTGNVGRYDDAIRLAERRDLGLPADQATLAPTLKGLGYATAVFGKWHMGYEPKFSPLDQGFEEFTGFLGGNVEYFQHVELSDLPVYLRGRQPFEREGYLTHLITDDALDFLHRREKDNDARPFFLYLPHAAPHFPFQGPGDDTGELPTTEQWTQGSRETYVKMLEDLDTEVGRLLAAIDATGQTDDTLVVFASDHGAMKPGLNTPFRDYKGTLFEGGIRVPLIARWPGHLKAETESDQVATLMDLTHSFLRIGGADTGALATLDGVDILQHVESGAENFERTLFWRARRDNETWRAVRDGSMKYVSRTDGKNSEEWTFDLAKDPGEQSPLASDNGGLHAKLAEWEKAVAPVR